jgi:hypothetical protein
MAGGATRVELGRLEITGISSTSAADERHLVFDPQTSSMGSLYRPIHFSAGPLSRLLDIMGSAQQGRMMRPCMRNFCPAL